MYDVTPLFNPLAYPIPHMLKTAYRWEKERGGSWCLFSSLSGRRFAPKAALTLLGYV